MSFRVAWPWRTRGNPPHTLRLVPSWTWLHRGGTWNPKVRAAVRGRAGVYAIRDRKTRTVIYVGESHAYPARDAARMWKTITRHFRDPSGKFQKRGEWTHGNPGACEISVWTTDPGDPERVLRDEYRAQRKFKPSANLKELAPF
jgi:hypothetical protein